MLRPAHLAAIVLLLAAACAQSHPAVPAPDLALERAAVDSVLTDLHQAASHGAWDRYFALYAPDAVFFGTDATERWDLEEFKGYASATTGWTYVTTERHVFVDADGTAAWFDERLQNASYGETRGTGVLIKGDSGWKVVQYNLTIPIPNDLARAFAEQIAVHASEADSTAP